MVRVPGVRPLDGCELRAWLPFGAPWVVWSGGGGFAPCFGSFLEVSGVPGGDCGSLAQAAPKQGRQAARRPPPAIHYLSPQDVLLISRGHTKPGEGRQNLKL